MVDFFKVECSNGHKEYDDKWLIATEDCPTEQDVFELYEYCDEEIAIEIEEDDSEDEEDEEDFEEEDSFERYYRRVTERMYIEEITPEEFANLILEGWDVRLV